MATVQVHCIECGGEKVIKQGTTPQGKQRYHCQDENCGRSFILDYTYIGHKADVKEQIIDMAMNGSGIRDTARVLKISPTTDISELKKKNPCIQKVNINFLNKFVTPSEIEVKWADENENKFDPIFVLQYHRQHTIFYTNYLSRLVI